MSSKTTSRRSREKNKELKKKEKKSALSLPYLLLEHRVVGRRRRAVALASSSSAIVAASSSSSSSPAAQGLGTPVATAPSLILILDRHSGVGLAQGDVGVCRRQRSAERARLFPGPRDRKDLEGQGVTDKGAL